MPLDIPYRDLAPGCGASGVGTQSADEEPCHPRRSAGSNRLTVS